MEFSKNYLQATTYISNRSKRLTPINSQNRFASLSIELENTRKNNYSDNQSNYDRGNNNYIKNQSNHIHQSSNANVTNAVKGQITVPQKNMSKTSLLLSFLEIALIQLQRNMALKYACFTTVISKELGKMILIRNLVSANIFSVPLMAQMLSSYVIISFPL